MQVGKPKTTGEEVDEEVGREVDGGRAIEGQGRREHRKAWGMSEERNGGRRGKKTWTDFVRRGEMGQQKKHDGFSGGGRRVG